MTNQSRERAKEGGKKAKVGYSYQEVRDDEETPGTTEKELGTRWGIEEGKSGRRGRASRQDTRPKSIPSGLDPAQYEQGSDQFSLDQPEKSGGDRQGLDQPEKSGGDRRDLDQAASADDDRSEKSLDQPVNAGDDRPVTSEEAVSDDDKIFYATDEGGQEDPDVTATAEGTWKRVERKGGRIASPSETSIVEEKLFLPESEGDETGSKHFPTWFDSEDNKEAVNGDDPEVEAKAEEAPKKGRNTNKKCRKKSPRKKRKGKQPVRPIGFREVISSISRV